MALTKSAWTDSIVGSLLISTCTVVCTTAENDAYTLKTSVELDPTREWMLVYCSSITGDAQAVPLDLYVGWASTFAITGDGATVAATDGAKYMQMYNDVVLAVDPLKYAFKMSPSLAVADVVAVASITTGNKVSIPVAPYYAFNLNGGSTLAAATHTFKIVQVRS